LLRERNSQKSPLEKGDLGGLKKRKPSPFVPLLKKGDRRLSRSPFDKRGTQGDSPKSPWRGFRVSRILLSQNGVLKISTLASLVRDETLK